ncbi:MAG: indole-3-glycerol phosphate synthase TrpC [Lachnospirales bacterium]
MSDILTILAENAYIRVKEKKKIVTLDEIKYKAKALLVEDFPFERSLASSGISFICECKKASPSKGIISPEFSYLDIALEYERAGADAISVLTEPKWFMGRNEYLVKISNSTTIPCLRKDFTIDEYMIYESKLLGAKAVLLICSILEKNIIKEYIKICDVLGLSAVVEAHTKEEINMAIDSGARIIGVNNRNLKNFQVNTENSKYLRSFVSKDIIFISESGIKSREEIKELESIGVNGVLIGEYLMRAENKKEKLAYLRGDYD